MALGITNSPSRNPLPSTPTSQSEQRTPLLQDHDSSSAAQNSAVNPGGDLGLKLPFIPLHKNKRRALTQQAQSNNLQGGGHGVNNNFLMGKLAELQQAFKEGKGQEWVQQNVGAVLGLAGTFALANLMWTDLKAAEVISTKAQLDTTQQILQISAEALKATKG